MQTSISKRFTKHTLLRSLFSALLALSSLNHLALAQSPIQPLQNDPAIRQQLNRKNYEPSNTPNPNNLFPFGGHRGTVEHRTGSIRITNNQTTPLGGGVELQQLNYKGEIGFHTRFTNHGWESHSPFDGRASKTGYGKGQSISDGYGPSSYAYTIKGTMVHPADGYEAPQGGGYPAPSKYGAHDRYNIKVSGQARRMVQKPLDLAYGAKAAWRNLQQTGMAAAVLARQNRNETYQPNPDRSIFGDVYERARVLSNNIKGLVQTGTWLPEVAFNGGAIGAIQAKEETKQYSRQYYQYWQDIKRQQNMDAKTLFWHLYNTSSQYEKEQRSKEPLQQVRRDISQAIHQAAENNPIAAAWTETALRLAPLKPMPKTPMPYVPAAAARSGADDFAGAVAARAAQQAAKKADDVVAAAQKANPNVAANAIPKKSTPAPSKPDVSKAPDIEKMPDLGKPNVPTKNSPKGFVGKEFEDWFANHLGGRNEFQFQGRNFDGAIGNRWDEAKSGNYWNLLLSNESKLNKFRSDMGARQQIARNNGASYELHSNVPIPESIKQWLDKKGIPYFEY